VYYRDIYCEDQTQMKLACDYAQWWALLLMVSKLQILLPQC